MTMFIPPIQRKKKVPEKYNPDTFRVISDDALTEHPKFQALPYSASFEPQTPKSPLYTPNTENGFVETKKQLRNTRTLPGVMLDHRAHKPQPTSCGFLDKNVRLLCEPICNVYTHDLKHEEGNWWPARANPGTLMTPPYAEDTHYRIHYNYRQGNLPPPAGRHTASKTRDSAVGAVPVNFLREKDGSQRFFNESISYEHQYNSRRDPNYPNRGKRHGAFVWSRMDPISQRKFIEYYSRLEEEERQAQDKTGLNPSESGHPLVIRSADYKPKNKPTYAFKRRGSNILRWQSPSEVSPPSISSAVLPAKVVPEELQAS
ncbi:uncharacterized protein LOC131931098 [Physella acuta]|uniref:uncharacterized protein LOC131931098 n=1 Tax=Physella acuta TaxID=109671 RepID=UPI0027DBE1DE|nr:uncharacterized protein LOC131931098 [Physella acuta]